MAVAAFVGDGANPNGGLALDDKGAIYGTTQGGGINCPYRGMAGCGTVFKLTSSAQGDAWTEHILYRFPGLTVGEVPLSGLTFDATGNLYGTTELGGHNSLEEGTVFELAAAHNSGWTYRTLYSFSGANDGGQPASGVVFDKRGNLYGATTVGGTRGGTLYELGPTGIPSWWFHVLSDFGGSPNGAFPYGNLTLGSAGGIYGTTYYGGTGTNCGVGDCGTVFEATP